MPPKELLHLYNFIVVYSAAVLADVHAHGIYGALVGGEAHGVVLGDVLVGGFFGQYVDGVGHFQGDVHAPVARLVLGLYVGSHGKQCGVDERLVELLVLVLVGDAVGNAGIPLADDLYELLKGLVLETQVVEGDAQGVGTAHIFFHVIFVEAEGETLAHLLVGEA